MSFVSRCALAALLIAALGAEAASAACVSSTPASHAHSDDPADSEAGLAPEITALNANVDGACNLLLSYSIGNQSAMFDGDFLAWFLDSDGNAATGPSSGYVGADYAVGRLPDGAALLRYDAASGSFTYVRPLPASGPFGAVTTLDEVAAASGAATTVAGGTSYEGSYDTYFDFAPEPGQPAFPLPFAFSDSQPPPPPPPPPAAPTAPSEPAPPAQCRVPVLRRLTVGRAERRLYAAGCSVGRVRRVRASRRYAGRVVRTSPGAGAVRAYGARVTLYVGRRARRSRRSSAPAPALVALRVNRLAGLR